MKNNIIYLLNTSNYGDTINLDYFGTNELEIKELVIDYFSTYFYQEIITDSIKINLNNLVIEFNYLNCSKKIETGNWYLKKICKIPFNNK